MISPVLLAVLAALGGTSTEPVVRVLNGKLYVTLPDGMVGRIYIQRDGVDIGPTTNAFGQAVGPAVSADGVGSYEYLPRPEDEGKSLTPRVVNIGWEANPPKLYSLYVSTDEPSTTIAVFNENLLASSVPAPSCFTLSGTVETPKTAVSVTVSGNVRRVVWSSSFAPGDKPVETYTPPGVNALSDRARVPNAVAAYTRHVFNEFPVPATPVLLRTDESVYAVGGGGFVNAASNATTAFFPRIEQFGREDNVRATKQANFRAQIAEDGWAEMAVADADPASRAVGFGGSPTLGGMTACARLSGGTVTAYVGSTNTRASYTFASPSLLCRVRVRRVLPSGVITMDTSETGGRTWTTRYTFPSKSLAEDLLGFFYSNSPTVAIRGAALQGYSNRGF